MLDLSHLDEQSQQIYDLAAQSATKRTAKAVGTLNLSLEAVRALVDNPSGRSDILSAARVAAIQAMKQTGHLIPLCRVLPITHSRVDFDIDVELARIKATVTASGESSTSVEMEALLGVNVALLTIYDMMKAVDRQMVITQIHLVERTGGKSGNFLYDNKFENIDY